MKIKHLVIASLLILIPHTSKAAEVLTAPEEACKEVKSDFYEKGEITKKWALPDTLDSKKYNETFEKAQDAYHTYVGCMFEFAENTVYKTKGSDNGGTGKANLANSKLINWMAPDQACLSSTEIEKIIAQTTPTEMLGPILQAHSDYQNYLETLSNRYANRGEEVNAAGVPTGGSEQLLAKANFIATAERERQTEIDSSMVAIDLMFNSLKELRLSFVMHVHFQCTLKYLNGYRNALGDLRKLIQPLPDQLRDASITK